MMFKDTYLGKLLLAVYPRFIEKISVLESDVDIVRFKTIGQDGVDWIGTPKNHTDTRACFDVRDSDKFAVYADMVKRFNVVKIGAAGPDVVVSDMEQNMHQQRAVPLSSFSPASASLVLRTLFPQEEATYESVIARVRSGLRDVHFKATETEVKKLADTTITLANPVTSVNEQVLVRNEAVKATYHFVEACNMDDKLRERAAVIAGRLGCVPCKGRYPAIISLNNASLNPRFVAVKNVRYLWILIADGPYSQSYTTSLNEVLSGYTNALSTSATWANRVNRSVDSGAKFGQYNPFYLGIPVTDTIAETHDWIIADTSFGVDAFDSQKATGEPYLLNNGMKGPLINANADPGNFGFWTPPHRGGPVISSVPAVSRPTTWYIKSIWEMGANLDSSAVALGIGDHLPESAFGVPAKTIGVNNVLLEPLIGVPGDIEFAFRGAITSIETDQYEHPGFPARVIRVKTITMAPHTVCLGIPYLWYTEYLSTGYGLYKALDAKDVVVALDKSSDLAGTTMCCVMRSPAYEGGSSVIEKSVLYTDYKAAREGACQANNFYESKYDESRTWADIRTLVGKQPLLSDIYGIRFSSVTSGRIDNVGRTSLSWKDGTLDATSTTVAGVAKWTFVYNDGGGKSAPLKLDPEGISEAYANGLVVKTAAKTAMDALFGPETWKECVKTAATSRLLAMEAGAGRGTTYSGYDFAWENLGKSGYPVLDDLPVQVRSLACIVSVADYQVPGRQLRAIVNKFNTTILAQKAGVKA